MNEQELSSEEKMLRLILQMRVDIEKQRQIELETNRKVILKLLDISGQLN